jgi:hypothetical protein
MKRSDWGQTKKTATLSTTKQVEQVKREHNRGTKIDNIIKI